jgi:hypothetical protein
MACILVWATKIIKSIRVILNRIRQMTLFYCQFEISYKATNICTFGSYDPIHCLGCPEPMILALKDMQAFVLLELKRAPLYMIMMIFSIMVIHLFSPYLRIDLCGP